MPVMSRPQLHLGRCRLPDRTIEAHVHLALAREYASRPGNVEVTLRCYQLAAEIARCEVASCLLPRSPGWHPTGGLVRVRAMVARHSLRCQDMPRGREPIKMIEPAEWLLKRSGGRLPIRLG